MPERPSKNVKPRKGAAAIPFFPARRYSRPTERSGNLRKAAALSVLAQRQFTPGAETNPAWMPRQIPLGYSCKPTRIKRQLHIFLPRRWGKPDRVQRQSHMVSRITALSKAASVITPIPLWHSGKLTRKSDNHTEVQLKSARTNSKFARTSEQKRQTPQGSSGNPAFSRPDIAAPQNAVKISTKTPHPHSGAAAEVQLKSARTNSKFARAPVVSTTQTKRPPIKEHK